MDAVRAKKKENRAMRPAPYDWRLAARTLAVALVALAVVVLVEWITDERGVASPGTGGRSIGVLPVVPLAAGIAVLVALAPAASSGELRALAALGAPPWRGRAAPVVTASLLACLAALGIALGAMDVGTLFPRSAPASSVRIETKDGSTLFVSSQRHVHVGPDGVLVRDSEEPPQNPSADLPAHARAAAAFAVAFSGIALAAWVSSPSRRRPVRTLLVGACYAVALVAAFQAAGARAASAAWVVAPSLALLAVAMAEWRALERSR